jgi:5-methylthioadenosine/S-adenosylhomocysteine deaminase
MLPCRGTDEQVMTILIRAGRILEGFGPGDEPIVHEAAAIAVTAGVVAAIGPQREMERRYPDAQVLGGAETVVIPGLINAHHHIGTTPLQLGSPDHPLELWFASRLGLRDVDLYLDTLFSAFEMIESGVTTVQHLHSRAPGGAEDVLAAANEVIRAYRDIGLRASYSIALRDQNRLVYEADEDFVARLPERLRPAMSDYFRRFTLPLSEQIGVCEALLQAQGNDALVRVQLAPSNLHWLSDGALEDVAGLSERHALPMHMHLLETPYQKAYARKRTGGSAFAHVHRLGLSGSRLTLGHGVWMTEADIELCAETGTRICHNCSSNFRLKSGVAPVNRFLDRGIPVAIGIDEAGINDDRDMLQEMRLVLSVHREPGLDAPHVSAAQVMRMATEHGAATTPFGDRIGRLALGCAADLVLLDWRTVTRPYQSPDVPWLDVLLRRARTDAVAMVMIAGEIVYRDGRFVRVDKDAVLRDLAGWLQRPLTKPEQDRRELAREVLPYVKALYADYLDGSTGEPFYRVSGQA